MSNDDEAVFRDLFDHAFDALWVVSGDMVIEHANAAAVALSGYQLDELIGQNLSMLLPPSVAESHDTHVDRYKTHGESKAVLGKPRRFDIRARDGSLIPIQLKAFRLDAPEGAFRFGASMADLREQVSLEEEQNRMMLHLEKLALIDPLTELWNRRAFDDALDRQCAFVTRHKSIAALALIDIDHFKQINDTHGHAAGDRVLQQLAQKLKGFVRKEDICARIGGEEFALLMPATDLEAAKMTLERALQIVATGRFDIGDQRGIEITFSAGVSAIDPEACGKVTLERADQAMYRAKENGRARVELWEPESELVLTGA